MKENKFMNHVLGHLKSITLTLTFAAPRSMC